MTPVTYWWACLCRVCIGTVIDSDRVLVLDKGRVLEDDTPHNLLVNPESEFSSMVDALGDTKAQQLRAQARQKEEDSRWV